METETPKTAPILDIAWARVAALDAASIKRQRSYYVTRRWIAILGVVATLLAILTQSNVASRSALASVILKGLFVITPAVASGWAAFATKKFSNGDWLITRAGAEEIQKEIYFFRTVLQKKKSRRSYLEKRLAEIQRQIFRGLNGEFSYEKHSGRVPPNYYPDDPTSDPGFADLAGEEYFRYRVQYQLDWHNRKINQFKQERDRLAIWILLAGIVGTILAAISAADINIAGNNLGIWVALTASITAALIGWQELRNIDVIVRNYSKVVLELSILRDHWVNLEPEERTDAEFYKVVRGCENVLWAQNTEYIKSMQEALREANLEEEASLVNRVIQESVESDKRTKRAMRENLLRSAQEGFAEAEADVDETFKSAMGTLVQEASSDMVQQELEAMGQAAREAFQNVVERASSFAASIAQVKEEFKHVEISKDTSMEELNTILSRYPKTNEVKG